MPAHRSRLRRIRRGVVGASVAVFIAVWAIVAVQMAGGRDPALASSAKRAVRVAPPALRNEPAPQPGYSPRPSEPEQPAAPAPLTTHQS
jgi:hypothetical protein